MSVVVNVMLPSNECDEPSLCLMQPMDAHSGEVIFFRGKLGFLKSDYYYVVVYLLP